MPEQQRSPSLMPGLHIYVGNDYWGQILERVGENHWLVLDPDEKGFRVMQVSDLRSARLYKEKISDND